MLKRLLLGTCALILSTSVLATQPTPLPKVLFTTSMGKIEVELRADKAPLSVANFLNYVDQGFYDNTLFHRVISGFIVQGGGFDGDFNRKTPGQPIVNESHNGLQNLRGTLAMARMQGPDSATSQFFINLQDNNSLNYGSRGAGYAVFAHVTQGMDVVEQIAEVATQRRGMMRDVPVEPVRLIKVERHTASAAHQAH